MIKKYDNKCFIMSFATFTILSLSRKERVKSSVLLGLATLLLAVGCARKVVVIPRPEPVKPKEELPLMRYSIQMGAFLNLDNAILLSESLERQGLNAYYFRHKTGLYKVRFGDFPSKEEARAKADRLSTDGIIEEYYIVSPDDYALAKARRHGSKELRDEIVETAESWPSTS
jgi:hypothetical protein